MFTIITIFISTTPYHHDHWPVQHDQIPPSPLPSGQEGKTTEDFQETDKGRQGWGPWWWFWYDDCDLIGFKRKLGGVYDMGGCWIQMVKKKIVRTWPEDSCNLQTVLSHSSQRKGWSVNKHYDQINHNHSTIISNILIIVTTLTNLVGSHSQTITDHVKVETLGGPEITRLPC